MCTFGACRRELGELAVTLALARTLVLALALTRTLALALARTLALALALALALTLTLTLTLTLALTLTLTLTLALKTAGGSASPKGEARRACAGKAGRSPCRAGTLLTRVRVILGLRVGVAGWSN
jgi:hypothetical protein